jgi:sugar lactone lactonase YvrE
MRRHLRAFVIAAAAAVIALPTAGAAGATEDDHDRSAGAVFVGTNHNNTQATDPSEPANQVVMYHRADDGSLALVGSFDTGGQGSGPGVRFAGDGLGAANSVTLSQNSKLLFVTNAGSNTLSMFRVHTDRLELLQVVATGDGSPSHRFPNSVTQFGNLVYVLNAADEGSITGFRLKGNHLVPLPGSTRTLNANGAVTPTGGYPPDALYDPVQVAFTPDGSKLVVSIKDSNPILETPVPGPGRVLVWSVDRHGLPSDDYRQTDFANRGPFGFEFDRDGNIVIALFTGGSVEAVPGVGDALTAAAGSYRINEDGSLTALTATAPDHQLDTCWVVNNGVYAYGANYTSNTISSWKINEDGTLTLLEAVAGTVDLTGAAQPQGPTPLDARISPDGETLYDVLPGAGRVAAWHINEDGTLTKLGEYAGLPRTVDGDHAPFPFGPGGSPAGIDVS